MLRSKPLPSIMGILAFAGMALAQTGSAPSQFQVDGSCKITEVLDTPRGPKEHGYHDAGICQVSPEKETRRTVTDMDTGERLHIHITIR